MTLTVTQNLQTIDISDLQIEQVRVDSDDDIDSIETVSQHLSKAKVDNVEQCSFVRCSILRYSTLIVIISLVFQCILTAYSHQRFITLKDCLVHGNCGSA